MQNQVAASDQVLHCFLTDGGAQKDCLIDTSLSSFEHPEQMLKLMYKKTFSVLCSRILPIFFSVQRTICWSVQCFNFFLLVCTCKNVSTVKPVLSGHSKRRPKLVVNTNYRLLQVKSIAECSKRSILQYFRPSLSYHLSLSPCFVYF